MKDKENPEAERSWTTLNGDGEKLMNSKNIKVKIMWVKTNEPGEAYLDNNDIILAKVKDGKFEHKFEKQQGTILVENATLWKNEQWNGNSELSQRPDG